MGIDAGMFVRARGAITEKDIKHLSWRLCEAVGAENFIFDRDGRYPDCHPGGHALCLIPEYTQDGPTIKPDEGETFVEVYMWHRYYGPGYERGPWHKIKAIGDWLEANVGEVWYGGDSSGVLAERWADVAVEIQAHWLRVGGVPYRSNRLPRSDDSQYARHCDFCDEPMERRGWGDGFAVLSCLGCGTSERTNDGGKTWITDGGESHGDGQT